MTLILSGTDGLSEVDGTAATPALRGTDANTGIFFPAADTIAFAEGGAEVARFDSSGRLGIGTTSPNRLLSLFATQPVFQITNVASGNTQGTIQYQVSGSTDFVLDNQGSGSGGIISFSQAGTERVRITSGGNLFVNCTSEPSSSVKGWGITQIGSGNYVSSATTTSGNFDHYYFYSVSGLAGFIRTNGTTCTYNSVSDVRLKENIVDAPSALVTVNNIKVRSFDWKSNNNHVDYGFVAQELNDVAPQAVAEGKTTDEGEIKTPWAIDTSMLIPILVKSIQEQQALITQQAAAITSLTTRITALEAA